MSFEVSLSGVSNVPQSNLDALLRAHPGLVYGNGRLAGEAQIPEEYIAQDISFALANKIPAENTASRLENYKPQNPTQGDLLDKARFLSRAKGRFMGLIALGGAGIGKTHIAVGLAKSLENSGQASRYVHVPSVGLELGLRLPDDDETFIIDDLNAPYGWGRQHFSNIITRMHHNGSGRLFITSNVAPERYGQFMMDMIGGTGPNDPEFIRISDRAGAALRAVAVMGNSYRHSQTEDPWADYQPDVQRAEIERPNPA